MTLDVPAQEVITRDNVTVQVNAVAYFRVVDPECRDRQRDRLHPRHLADRPDDAAQRARPSRAWTTCCPSAKRSTSSCSRSSTSRPSRGASRSASSRSRTSSCRRRCSGRWRARPRPSARSGPRSSTPRASSRPARSSRRRRAVIDQNPVGIQLRYLQTLTEIAAEKNTTIVFPLPIDLISGLFQRSNGTEPAPIASVSETAPE